MATVQRSQPTCGVKRLSATILTLVCATALAGCFTGQRPSFENDEPLEAETGVTEVDAILERLDAVGPTQFTANYEILTRLGSQDSTATVVQADNSRRSITINDVRFIDSTDKTATCNLQSGECEATLNDARVSDLQMNHNFYARSFARRLRVDTNRRVGEVNGYTITQADQQVQCVDIPVTGGNVTYCALDSGPLARYDGADLFIEMTSFSDVPDESAFATE
ncbi:MAG: hypothetical protein KUG57_03250 [Ilumatobacteraceae bacterium]|nr:hypothetical protein [Ilumatobacteraceae bacterium]